MITRSEIIREQENLEMMLNVTKALLVILLKHQAFLVEMELHVKDESGSSDSSGIETS